MKDTNCSYCMRNELLDAFGLFVCELPSSILVLFREQSHPGRCIVAAKDHVSEITDMTEEQMDAFYRDVRHVAAALHQAFHPDKVNYGSYADTGHHLHVHLVPKYKDDFEWDSTFTMNPDRIYLSDVDYKKMIDKIKEQL